MDLLLEHHYLRRRTAEPMFVFTWRDDDSGGLLACGVFCAPANRHFGKGSVELSRLVRTPECTAPLTKFLALCMRALKADPRKIKFLLSYADTGAGHHGGIYQAFNGIYVRKSKPSHTLWKHRETGEIVSKRSMDQRSPERREGFEKVAGSAKHLYVWPLHEKRKNLLARFGWESLPYPKPDTKTEPA